MALMNQQLVQLVKAAIWGYQGPHKWGVARAFVATLTDEEQRVFAQTYRSRLAFTGDVEDALLTAARPYRGRYNLAAALLSGHP
jgi:hypothetical protein